MSVRLRHPDLEGQEIDVADSAVPFHRSAGWQVIEGQHSQGEEWPAELQPLEGQPPTRMVHPDLPGQEITIAESAVPFHREKGWVLVEEPAGLVEEPEDDGRDDLTVAQLQDEARARGLTVSGTKAELLERLRAEQDVEQDAGVAPAETTEEE